MRFALAPLAFVLATSASASILARQTIPTCANPCLFGPNVDLDGCGPTDNVCLCKSQAFVSKSTTCIESACSGADLQSALTVAQQLCASVGVTLTSTPAAPTDAATSSAADDEASSTASAAPSTAADASASSTPAASGSAKPTSTAPSSSKPSSAAASSTSPSASAPATSSNAASLNSLNAVAGLAAVGLAALAL